MLELLRCMRFNRFAGYLVGAVVVLGGASSAGANVRINEFVVDPQGDYNLSGGITDSDEFFELYNSGNSSVDLGGWRLELIDTTPATKSLDSIIGAKGYFLIINPVGAQNDNGRLELYDNSNTLVDAVSYGNWDDGNLLDNLPSGNSLLGVLDDSLSRVPDGSSNWIKTYATPGYSNGIIPEPFTASVLGWGVIGLLGSSRRRI